MQRSRPHNGHARQARSPHGRRHQRTTPSPAGCSTQPATAEITELYDACFATASGASNHSNPMGRGSDPNPARTHVFYTARPRRFTPNPAIPAPGGRFPPLRSAQSAGAPTSQGRRPRKQPPQIRLCMTQTVIFTALGRRSPLRKSVHNPSRGRLRQTPRGT